MSLFRRLLGRQYRADLLIAQAHETVRMNNLTARFNDEVARLNGEIAHLNGEVVRLHTEIGTLKATVTQLANGQAGTAQGLTDEIAAIKAQMPQLLNAAGTMPALAEKLRKLESALVQNQKRAS